MDRRRMMASIVGRIEKDGRLNVYHTVLMLVMLNKWLDFDTAKTILISRAVLMRSTRIGSIVTYHKYISELQEFGYIIYLPSYHPRFGSAVSINF